uniref:Secreted protein n=1 Tax=Heterorhabditis bacteriophora TaxID=37862 RepID=A0A1I7X5K7_HETBA
MHIILLLLLTVLNVFCSSPTTFPTEHAYQDGKILRVPLNDTASEDLLEKWLSQAVSGLMAAVASRRRPSTWCLMHYLNAITAGWTIVVYSRIFFTV